MKKKSRKENAAKSEKFLLLLSKRSRKLNFSKTQKTKYHVNL